MLVRSMQTQERLRFLPKTILPDTLRIFIIFDDWVKFAINKMISLIVIVFAAVDRVH